MEQSTQWQLNQTLVLATVTLALFTDFFLYGIVVPVVPFILRERLAVPEYQIQHFSSVLLASYAAAAVVFSVPVGWATDKIGSRQSPFLYGLALLLASTVLFTWGTNIVVIIIARALQGISSAVVWTVGFAMVHDVVPSDQMGRAVGTILSLTAVGDITAPVFGGFLYEKAGVVGIFGVSASLLIINLFMRLMMIDIPIHNGAAQSAVYDDCPAASGTVAATERTSLIPPARYGPYGVPDAHPRWAPSFPVLSCCRDPQMAMAFVLTFAQSSVFGLFTATIRTEAEALFHFSSFRGGLLFIALIVPYLLFGALAGKTVDRFGTHGIATAAYGLLVPSLLLLGLPSYRLLPFTSNVVLFCAILALNGILMVLGSSTSFVEASDVMEKYEHSNPRVFVKSAPFAQIYGFNTLFLLAGLTVGPVVGDLLRSAFGFQVMLMVMAGFSAMMSILSFLFIGV